MDHILFKPTRLLVLAAMMLGTSVLAQSHSAKRSVSKSFPASRETTLEVQNKYGKIQVVAWENDSVMVDVDIFMTESSPSKL